MQYNTQRSKLPMPEYGRGIQNMVEHALSIPDRQERQRCANTIVTIMGNMFPHLRDVFDFKHKLWDHLAIMADFKLDIDYPYDVIQESQIKAKPKPLSYPNKKIRYRHYGFLLETLLKKLEQMPEGQERDLLTEMVANQMKRSLGNWNKDGMDDEKIASDMAAYTHGVVRLDLGNFRFSSIQARPLASTAPQLRNNRRNNNRKRF